MSYNSKILLKLCSLGIGIFLVVILCFYAWPIKQGEPELKLSLQKLVPTSQEIILQLIVTNIGEHDLVIPRLEEGMWRQYLRANGWMCRIQETTKYGQFVYEAKDKTMPNDLVYKTSSALLQKRDLITLKPDENFSVTLNITDMKWASIFSEDYKQPLPELAETPGVYKATIELGVGDEIIPFLLSKTVWHGWKESNTVTFVIDRQKEERTP